VTPRALLNQQREWPFMRFLEAEGVKKTRRDV
jgi:hypothetical protein